MLALLFEAGNRLQQLGLVYPLGGEDGAESRLALGEGPCLIPTTRVFTFSSVSSASALRTRIPSPAPRPVPTMMDIGVARA